MNIVNPLNLPGDELPALVKKYNEGQTAIPLEFRDLLKPFKTDGLLGSMKEIIRSVRRLNCELVPEEKQKTILEEVARKSDK